MAIITALTSPEMLRIENETVIDGIVQNHNLFLTQKDTTRIDAGNVQGPQGPPGSNGTNGTNGTTGPVGKDGITIPSGGAIGQILAKKSNTNYDLQWQNDYILPDDVPRGFINTIKGPTASMDCLDSNLLLAELSIPVVVGRRYRATFYATGTQVTAAGTSRFPISGAGIDFDGSGSLTVCWAQNLAAGQVLAGGADFSWVAIANPAYMRLYGVSGGAGALRVGANVCSISVEDIGT